MASHNEIQEALNAGFSDAARIATLEASNTQLREALEKYGRHDKLCCFVGGYIQPCDCGYRQALDASHD